MNNGICYVIGAGTDYGLDFCPDKGDFVIAADGGFSCLEKPVLFLSCCRIRRKP